MPFSKSHALYLRTDQEIRMELFNLVSGIYDIGGKSFILNQYTVGGRCYIRKTKQAEIKKLEI